MATARSSVKVNDLLSLEDIWGDLKAGIEQIFGRQALSKGHLMELYSHVYNYCGTGALQQSKELYQRLEDFLKAYQDDGLLKVCSQ